GVPGYTMLDGQYCYPDKGSGATADEEAHHPLDLWPETDTMPELRRIASDALNAIALDLATYMPDPVAAKLPDINAALKLFYSRGSGFSYDAAGAADHVVTLPGNLLAGSPLSRLHRLANAGDVDTRVSDRSIELIGHVVTHVLRQRLTMVADQLASFLGPLMTDDGHQTEDWRTLRAQLGPLVAPLLDVFLRAAERRARDAAYEAVAAYTAAGPISVRIRTGA
ncbi:MAG: hypothetical protein ACRDTZ_10025, partial [Pseudonocardiaceae bacterium]